MTPLAFLHGFTGTPGNWSVVRERLSPRTTLAPPLLGHTPGTLDLAIDGFEDEVDRIARELSALATKVHVCGYSLGGRIALGLTVRHPDLVARATLIGAHAGLLSEAERSERERADGEWCRILEHDGLPAFVERWERLPLFATQARLPDEVLARQRAERLSHDPRGLVRSLQVTGLARMPAYWDALGSVRCPVTLLVGELDEKFRAIAERMCEALPESRVVLARNAGHNVVLEAPDVVARELVA